MKYLCLILLMFLLAVPSLAQDDELVTINLTGAFDISIPASWEVTQKTATGLFWTTGDSQIRIRTYNLNTREFFGVDDRDLGGMLEWLAVEVLESRSFDAEAITEVEFGDYAGSSYRYEALDQGRRFERQLNMFGLDNEILASGYIDPLEDAEIKAADLTALHAALASITRRDTVRFYDGASFDLSDHDWLIRGEAATGIAGIELSKAPISMRIFYWPRYAVMAGFENPSDFLGFIWNANFAEYGAYDRSKTEAAQVAGFDGIYYAFNSQTLNQREMYGRGVYIFELTSNGSYVSVYIMTDGPDDDYGAIFPVIDSFSAGNRIVCPLFADPGVSIRERPTTNSDRVRQTEDEVLVAEYETTGDDGFRWFNVGEGWIRADVIFFELNTCVGLPVRA